MEFKGTKGKWHSSYRNGSWLIQNEDDFNNNSTNCIAESYYFNDGRDTAEANVKLISKAPQMLEMLQNQLEFLIYCRDNMKVSRPVFNQKVVRLEKLIKEATEL
jgi:hypothetical protein